MAGPPEENAYLVAFEPIHSALTVVRDLGKGRSALRYRHFA